MPGPTSDYRHFVEHPLYGRGPRITGLDPSPGNPKVHLNSNTISVREIIENYEAVVGPWPYGDAMTDRGVRRIRNTAVAADVQAQTAATIPVTHYFDLERVCVDCDSPFIFFAEEQKHWYEKLGFKLDADCVRCIRCRKKQQRIAGQRRTYETMFHMDRSVEQNLQMADACLSLIEAGAFPKRRLETVRMLLNGVPLDAKARREPRFAELQHRLNAIVDTE